MSKNKEEIIDDIKRFIGAHGGGYPAWYVGVSADARSRLFTGHNVDEKDDCWIYRTASSSQVAREIEDYFIDVLGTDGASGGGDETTDKVYAYKKSARTNP